MQGHDVHPDAAVCLDGADRLGNDPARDAALIGSADHVALGSFPGRSFLRYPGRRLGGALATLLLAVRTSRSLHPDYSSLRLHFGDHSGFFAQADLRLSGDGCRNNVNRSYQRWSLGPPHVQYWHDGDGQYVFRSLDVARWRADRDQDLQLAGDAYGGQLRFEPPMVFCLGFL